MNRAQHFTNSVTRHLLHTGRTIENERREDGAAFSPTMVMDFSGCKYFIKCSLVANLVLPLQIKNLYFATVMEPILTENAILKLLDGSTKMQPLLQVVNIGSVYSSKTSASHYHITLSDGTYQHRTLLPFAYGTHSFLLSVAKVWKPTVPSWEKEYCDSVGLPWKELCKPKEYISCYDSVLNWNNYDPNIYIDVIDCNAEQLLDIDLPDRDDSESENLDTEKLPDTAQETLTPFHIKSHATEIQDKEIQD